jgi:NADH-quinone oxidoreductase subunit F
MMGAEDLLEFLGSELGVEPGGTTPDGLFTLEECQCLGQCALSPAMMVDGRVFARLSPESARAALDLYRTEDRSAAEATAPGPAAEPVGPRLEASACPGETRIALRYIDAQDPEDIRSYEAAGGWAGLRAAFGKDPDDLVADLTKAGLRGRGGAGFPTGTKERSTAQTCEDCDRYVVVNADEGEPGTFKDRIILEREPQLLLEGLVISAYAIGARMGYIYVRGEYTRSIRNLRTAIDQAKAGGYLGENILGSGFDFDVEIRRGAGSYLCGEELTLLESLEGKRGYPRIKPPFPAEKGLWGKPTLVNNVETLANVPWIAEKGADAYLALGVPGSPGTKIFCVSGDVARPGFYEAELGISLRDLVEGFAGGVSGAGEPAAFLLGGAAGTFASPGRMDIRLDYDTLKKEGLTLGSGAVIVLGPGRDPADTILSILEFFRHESCGKCVPCRVGTARLAEAGRALAAAGPGERLGILDAMVEEARRMAATSLCPLGQSPILPLASAARELREALT